MHFVSLIPTQNCHTSHTKSIGMSTTEGTKTVARQKAAEGVEKHFLSLLLFWREGKQHTYCS